MDEKTALFNQYSFETVLEEYDAKRQKIIIAVLCFCKIENNLDWKQDALILKDIYKGFKLYRLQGYRVCENGVAFISNSQGKARLKIITGKKTLVLKPRFFQRKRVKTGIAVCGASSHFARKQAAGLHI